MDLRDELILVDERDEAVGTETRAACHAGLGRLHRAFSVYVFDREDRLLLQRRSRHKLLWPGHWSNSCCSHPRPGEEPRAAAEKRVHDELGFATALEFAFKYRYHASYGAVGSESELCWVFLGRHSAEVHPDPAEVADWRFAGFEELADELARAPHEFTPWFRIAWPRIVERRAELFAKLSGPAPPR
jgi:isopentenyl-diphosphate Delta-isomerase